MTELPSNEVTPSKHAQEQSAIVQPRGEQEYDPEQFFLDNQRRKIANAQTFLNNPGLRNDLAQYDIGKPFQDISSFWRLYEEMQGTPIVLFPGEMNVPPDYRPDGSLVITDEDRKALNDYETLQMSENVQTRAHLLLDQLCQEMGFTLKQAAEVVRLYEEVRDDLANQRDKQTRRMRAVESPKLVNDASALVEQPREEAKALQEPEDLENERAMVATLIDQEIKQLELVVVNYEKKLTTPDSQWVGNIPSNMTAIDTLHKTGVTSEYKRKWGEYYNAQQSAKQQLELFKRIQLILPR